MSERKQESKVPKTRRWQLTENNPDYDKRECSERLSQLGATHYVLCAQECGLEQGTRHIHAFIIYENAISRSSLKKAFPRAHFEPCVGTNTSNVAYLRKQDKEPFEKGELPKAYSKKVEEVSSKVVRLMAEGAMPSEIALNEPGLADYVIHNFSNLERMYVALGHIREMKK